MPFPINTWSRSWTNGKTLSPVPLGEVETGPQPYAPDPIRQLPRPILLGSQDCLQNGERWPLPLLARTYVEGWDRRCFPPGPGGPGPLPAQIDVLECLTQRKLIEILDTMYSSISAAQTILETWLPGVVVAAVPNSDSVVPGTLIGIWGQSLVVLVSGTTNPQQWALQAFFGAAGPRPYSGYSTLEFWQDSADQISLRIDNVGWSGTGPVILAGHSYGGALACLLALRSRYSLGAGRVGLFTIGCPKPGDLRLTLLLSDVRQAHLVNDDDPIPHIPPSGREVSDYQPISTGLNVANWFTWARPAPQIGLSREGVRGAVPAAVDVYGLVARLIFQWINWGRVDLIWSHLSSEYLRRCVCPAQPAPGPSPWSADLWLREEGIVGRVGDIAVWLPTDGTPREGRTSGTAGLDPVSAYDATTDLFGGEFRSPPGPGQRLVFDPIVMAGDFATFVVGRPLGPRVTGPALSGPSGCAMPSVQSTLVNVLFDDETGFTWPVVPGLGVLGIWSVRRTGNVVKLGYNGAGVVSGINTATCTLDNWQVWRLPVSPAGSGTAWMPEVIVVNRSLSDSEYEAWLDYLANKYLTEIPVLTGSIVDYAGAVLPVGYLVCDGAAVSRTTFAALFAAIGTTWGAGNGTTTFNVPDLRGRMAIGAGTGSGLSPRTLAGTGGAESVELTEGQLAPHSHIVASNEITLQSGPYSDIASFLVEPGTEDSNNNTYPTGSGDPVPTMAPFRVVSKIIKT